MANLISRLIMDATQYDGGLQKAQKSLDKFLDKTLSAGNIVNGFAGSLTKVAGAAGLAMGGLESLNRVIQGSQKTGDAYTRMMDQAKASIDSFFAAASMGDMSRFTDNLQTVIDKARELSIELDNLGTMELYNRANMRELNAQYQIELNAAKDRSKSDKERAEHLKKARDILIQMNKKDIALGGTKEKVSYKMLNAEMAQQGFGVGIGEKTWNFLLNSNNRPMIDEAAEKYQKTITDYENRIFAAKVTDTFTGAALDTEESKALQKELDDYKKSTAGLVGNMYYTFTQIADDTNSAVAKALDLKASSAELKAAISARELEVGNTLAKIEGSYNKQHGISSGGGTGKGKKEISPIFNYEQLNEEIKTAISGKDALSQTVLDAISTGKTLPVLTQPIQATMINSEDEKAEGEDPMDALRSKMDMYTLAQNKIQELTGMLSVANEEEKKYLNEQIAIWEQYANELDGISQRKKQMNKMAQDLNDVGTSLSKIGSLSDGAFGSMLDYLGGIVTATAAAIPAITALTEAKNKEANANLKAATTGAASSVASIPFVGAIMAVAAVASVIAAIMSVPSFAEGGVIGGSNYMDGITARVSSGEMIMNEADQKKLYNAIHSGNLGNGGGGKAIVTGEQIVTVINNYGKRTGKGVILKG